MSFVARVSLSPPCLCRPRVFVAPCLCRPREGGGPAAFAAPIKSLGPRLRGDDGDVFCRPRVFVAPVSLSPPRRRGPNGFCGPNQVTGSPRSRGRRGCLLSPSCLCRPRVFVARVSLSPACLCRPRVFVAPAKAGAQRLLQPQSSHWVPACAGTTGMSFVAPVSLSPPRRRGPAAFAAPIRGPAAFAAAIKSLGPRVRGDDGDVFCRPRVFVAPANAGAQRLLQPLSSHWVPAFAGTTVDRVTALRARRRRRSRPRRSAPAARWPSARTARRW